jgi:mannosylglycoprotein endo-beta-mannosidase
MLKKKLSAAICTGWRMKREITAACKAFRNRRLVLPAERFKRGKSLSHLTNPAGGPVAFFNRLSLFDPKTKKRLLPVFYDDNYVSILPGESKTLTLEYTPNKEVTPLLSVEGWNVEEKLVQIN